MAQEKKRYCGFRKVGSLYLVGFGIALPCDGLPIVLETCECCGFEIPFFRGFKWISKKYIEKASFRIHPTMRESRGVGSGTYYIFAKQCNCSISCPICYPERNSQTKYGFMWVGDKYYSPDSFVHEAVTMGISKKIAKIPTDLVLGQTWILLAHPNVSVPSSLTEKWVEHAIKPAIFYAFIPQRIELLLEESWARQPNFLEYLKQRGITPVIVPDDDKDHKSKKGDKLIKELYLQFGRSLLTKNQKKLSE